MTESIETSPRESPRPVRFSDIDLARYDGVMIDLDDTLYRYATCNEHGVRAAYGLGLWPGPQDEFAKEYRRARTVVTERLHPQGACRSRLFAFQAMLEARHVGQAFVHALALDRAYWDSFLEMMTPDEGALAFLDRCNEAGKPVCVVTDMTARIQIEKLVRLGVQSRISCLVTSEEVGAEKPDPRMFDAALDKMRLERDAVLMLGDDYRKDILGANAVGIEARLIKLDA